MDHGVDFTRIWGVNVALPWKGLFTCKIAIMFEIMMREVWNSLQIRWFISRRVIKWSCQLKIQVSVWWFPGLQLHWILLENKEYSGLLRSFALWATEFWMELWESAWLNQNEDHVPCWLIEVSWEIEAWFVICKATRRHI